MNGTQLYPAVGKYSFTLMTAVVLLLVSAAGSLSAGAQQVQIISPADDAIVPQRFTLKWEAYSGAQSYAYWLEHDLGGTLPGDQPNPHFVGTATEIELQATITLDIEWYVIAYSDAEGTNEIARSQTQTFTTTSNAPTPTPTPAGFDFNDDEQQNGLDIFNFAWAWYMNRSMPQAPANFDDMDFVDNNVIDEEDLLALIGKFHNRQFIQLPPLPAPNLVRPPADFEMTVSTLANTQNLFEWTAVEDAVSYRFSTLKEGQSVYLAKSHHFSGTSTVWTGGIPAPMQQLETGRYFWFVEAQNAQGELGAQSEMRPFRLVQNPGGSPADLNIDGFVQWKDIFFFSRYWQNVETVGQEWNDNVNLDDTGLSADKIEYNDLLIFMDFYQQVRGQVEDPNRPQAPIVRDPEDGTVFTEEDVLAGRAKIQWDPIPGFQVGVGGSSYEIVFNPEGPNTLIFVVFTTSYTFTEADLGQTAIANSTPVSFIVRGVQGSGQDRLNGESSTPRSFTIQKS
jgi:hypothetical protein